MKKVALIACVSKKLDRKATVEEIYQSPLFKKNLAYAKQRKVDDIYILSAKHGLLELQMEIEPYNETLNTMSVKDKKAWAKKVLEDLFYIEDLDDTHFIILAGMNYRKYLVSELPHYEVPMEGLPIGKQLQWLTQQLQKEPESKMDEAA